MVAVTVELVVAMALHARQAKRPQRSARGRGAGRARLGVEAGTFDRGCSPRSRSTSSLLPHESHTTQWGAAPHRPGRCRGRALALGLNIHLWKAPTPPAVGVP